MRSPRSAAARLASLALALLALVGAGCAPVSPQTPQVRPGVAQGSPSPRPSRQPALEYAPGTAMAAISRRGTLRVATRDSRPRLALTDPFTGDLVGYEVDIAGLLARRLLGTGRSDSVSVRTDEDPLDALRQGRVDLVLSGVDREDVPSDLVGVGPYVEGARVLMVPVDGEVESISDLEDRRVCVGSGHADDLAALVDATAVQAPSLLDCGAAVGRGGLVAAYGDDLELFGVADAYPRDFELMPTGMADVGYVVVLRPDARGLRTDVAEALEDVVGSAEWEQAWRHHLGPTPPNPPRVR